MGALPEKNLMTATEFIAWSALQGDRVFELENGTVIKLASETARHALTKHAVAKALEAGIVNAGIDCRVFPDGMQILVDDNTVRLPDAAVQCSPIDMNTTTLNDPVILVEVVSPSSIYRDEKHKLLEYFLIPSVQHYLMIAPEDRHIVHFRRTDEPNKIDTTFVSSGLIDLSPPGISISVEDVFGEVDR